MVIKLNKILFASLVLIIISIIIFNVVYINVSSAKEINEKYMWDMIVTTKKSFIKWVDFNVTSDALDKTSKLDISSYGKNIHYNWIELLACLACKYGGNFKRFHSRDLDELINNLDSGKSIDDLTKNMKYYSYYREAYSAILCEFIGIKDDGSYGIKAYLPIAKNYAFCHYKDFGSSRSYGFSRTHLGNDLMGSIGTPIVAVESGTIYHLGWNQYGGWRIGIRSNDGLRYYYYAHLRKNHPYAPNLKEGMCIKAGDVIGYLGMTGYSIKENVNNINVPHLHFGMQLIFDDSQIDCPAEIWIDVYNIVEFLKKNRSEVYMSNSETKDYSKKSIS